MEKLSSKEKGDMVTVYKKKKELKVNSECLFTVLLKPPKVVNNQSAVLKQVKGSKEVLFHKP